MLTSPYEYRHVAAMLATSAESPSAVILQSGIYQAYGWRQGCPFPVRQLQRLTTSGKGVIQRGIEHSVYNMFWHWCLSFTSLHPAQLSSVVGLDSWHHVVTLPLWLCWDSWFHFKNDKPIFCLYYLVIQFSCLHGWGTSRNEQLHEGSGPWSTMSMDLVVQNWLAALAVN